MKFKTIEIGYSNKISNKVDKLSLFSSFDFIDYFEKYDLVTDETSNLADAVLSDKTKTIIITHDFLFINITEKELLLVFLKIKKDVIANDKERDKEAYLNSEKKEKELYNKLKSKYEAKK